MNDATDVKVGVGCQKIQTATDSDSAFQRAVPASVNIDGVQLWRGLGPARVRETAQRQQCGNGRENTAKRKQSKQ